MLTRTASNYVLRNLSYLVPQADKPFNFMYEPAPGVLRQNCQYRRHACAIHTARPIADSISLAVQGFELPEMEPNEVLIFKRYDSRKGQGRDAFRIAPSIFPSAPMFHCGAASRFVASSYSIKEKPALHHAVFNRSDTQAGLLVPPYPCKGIDFEQNERRSTAIGVLV
jgi:hypothetical protein